MYFNYQTFFFSIQVHYQMKNASIELDPIFRLYPPATEYQWKIVGKLYYDDLLMGGGSIDLSIFGYRKRNKLPLIH